VNLVTGATGLLGSHVLIELSKRNMPVRAAYRNEQKIAAVQALFHYYLKENAAEKWALVEWIKADLLDIDDLKNLVQGTTTIYHCAALVSFFKADFEACIQQNRYVTANLVDLANVMGVRHFCHVSSTASIGGKEALISEKSKWDEGGQHSGYGVSKRLAEREVWRGIEEGLRAVIVNPCVILGPAAPGSPSLQMLSTAQKGLRFYTSGANAVVDARDVAWAMVELVEQNVHAERFLVVGPQQTFRDLFGAFAQQLGRKAPSIAAPRVLTLLFAAVHELWCHISGKREGLTIETARSSHEVLRYDRNKIEQQLSFKYTPLADIIQNMIAGQAFIEKNSTP
jgi:nucleoside-diphosphate-sugar epimerase